MPKKHIQIMYYKIYTFCEECSCNKAVALLVEFVFLTIEILNIIMLKLDCTIVVISYRHI